MSGVATSQVFANGDCFVVSVDGRVLTIPKMTKKYMKQVEESLRRMIYFDPKRGFERSSKPLPENARDRAAIEKYNKERRLVNSWVPIVAYIGKPEAERHDFLVELFMFQFGVESIPEDVLFMFRHEIEKLANLLSNYI